MGRWEVCGKGGSIVLEGGKVAIGGKKGPQW